MILSLKFRRKYNSIVILILKYSHVSVDQNCDLCYRQCISQVEVHFNVIEFMEYLYIYLISKFEKCLNFYIYNNKFTILNSQSLT